MERRMNVLQRVVRVLVGSGGMALVAFWWVVALSYPGPVKEPGAALVVAMLMLATTQPLFRQSWADLREGLTGREPNCDLCELWTDEQKRGAFLYGLMRREALKAGLDKPGKV